MAGRWARMRSTNGRSVGATMITWMSLAGAAVPRARGAKVQVPWADRSLSSGRSASRNGSVRLKLERSVRG